MAPFIPALLFRTLLSQASQRPEVFFARKTSGCGLAWQKAQECDAVPTYPYVDGWLPLVEMWCYYSKPGGACGFNFRPRFRLRSGTGPVRGAHQRHSRHPGNTKGDLSSNVPAQYFHVLLVAICSDLAHWPGALHR